MSVKKQPQNPLLYELLVVILFFALSACLLIRLFANAYLEGRRAEADGCALNWAEDLAERYYASDAEANAFLRDEGWTEADGAFTVRVAFHSVEYECAAVIRTDAYNAGHVTTIELTVKEGEREAFSLPTAKYVRVRETVP